MAAGRRECLALRAWASAFGASHKREGGVSRKGGRDREGLNQMSGPMELAEEPEGGAGSGAGCDPACFVTDRLVRMEQAEIELPHIVLSRSAETGEANYSGPYSCGLNALHAAEVEHLMELEAGGSGEITFHVAPLYPPVSESASQGRSGPGREATLAAEGWASKLFGRWARRRGSTGTPAASRPDGDACGE